MSNEYIPQLHCFASFKHPTIGWLYHGPCEIVLHTGKQVWIPASYAMEMPEGVKMVSDGRSNGFDEQGNCIYSIPVEWVDHYLDENEAEQSMLCLEADDAMLRNAY